ncbi:MAG TPA: sugar porter family MFS transporter [Chitinophagales bacterium]|nr:sugar porter family MFS transporter [Chitinophagales bacterium]
MNKILFWSFSVALAGFLFGFDTIVISGADQKLQELWNTSDVFHGFVVMASALWGTVIGAMTGGIPTNKYGRKNTLIAIGVLYFVSALGSALANDPYTFAFFRFIGGLGIGASTIAAPAYISEIAPPQKRGRLVAMYQLAIVVGILTAFLSNYLLRNVDEQPWRWMIGIAAFPSLIYGIAVLFIPNSPRWLVMKGRVAEAEKVLKMIDPGTDIDSSVIDSDIKINSFVAEIRSAEAPGDENIFMKKYRPALLLAFFIAFFNQFSGINAILYYAPRIFEEAGLVSSSALLSSAGMGLINLFFTLIGMALIDRLGRKQLMYIGSFGYIISLTLVALSFFFGWKGLSVPVFLFVFIAAHAIGQGTVIWVFIAELFPTHLRASGQAFGSSVHWVLAAAIPSLIPFLFSKVGAEVVFAIFALMMVGQLLWVRFKMPETKGVSLEEVSRSLMI